MNNAISLIPLVPANQTKFIQELQAAFAIAVIAEFGEFDSAEPVISEKDIIEALLLPGAEAYQIIQAGQNIGGTVIMINRETQHNSLSLLYINPEHHSQGAGLAAWEAIEKLHPETKVWETHTPYFEKRNIHFYVNKCGFKIVEFFNPHHLEPQFPKGNLPFEEYFFRFEKIMLQ